MFDSIEKNDSGIESITFGNNKKGKIIGLGKIAISNDMSVSNVLLVESLDFNILSVAQICDLGFKCIFEANEVEVISIYLVDFGASEAHMSTCLISKSRTSWL